MFDFLKRRWQAIRAAFMREQDPEHKEQGIKSFAPHCDSGVLHAPGECVHCDKFADWQEYRKVAGIAFTGHSPAAHQVPCPSDQRRGHAKAHAWPGNRPRHRGNTSSDDPTTPRPAAPRSQSTSRSIKP